MEVAAAVDVLRTVAPLEYAAEWDNVGLLIGSPRWSARRVLLTIDLTAAVLHEAADGGCDLVVAYHPPIFRPLPRLTDAAPAQRIALEAARLGIAVYSPHTALDGAPGGLNDWLAEGLGPGDVSALAAHEALPATEQCKVVTFCPAEAVEGVRASLAAAGAGRIGDYELCSFELRGTGTFFGGETTSPAVGARGTPQRVDEVRLEMVCAEAALGGAVAALRASHPYEEPPIDVYRLHPRPQPEAGAGRRVVLETAQRLEDLAAAVKHRLGVGQLRVALPESPPRRYRTVGLCAGAGGSLRPAASAAGCELFLTGEMRHHHVLAACADGCAVMLAGHTNTERGYLPVLRRRLLEALPELEIAVAAADVDPLAAM